MKPYEGRRKTNSGHGQNGDEFNLRLSWNLPWKKIRQSVTILKTIKIESSSLDDFKMPNRKLLVMKNERRMALL